MLFSFLQEVANKETITTKDRANFFIICIFLGVIFKFYITSINPIIVLSKHLINYQIN